MALDDVAVKEKLIDIFQQFTKASREDLFNLDFSEAELDSLTIVEILFQIEDQFQVEIPDERAKKIDRFPNLLEMVEELLKAKQGS